MRINKFLANIGICSRREADSLIESGKISVNAHKPELGKQLEDGDEVTYKNKSYFYYSEEMQAREKVYLAFFKPKGITCTCAKNDPNNIIDFIKYPQRIYPVGRLDKESKGLIILTNDGEFANKIMHPKFEHEKEYVVKTRQPIKQEFIEQMSSGVKLEEKTTSKCTVEKLAAQKFRIILKEGLNRQIRRMCQQLGYDVSELIRIRVDKLSINKLEALKEGSYVRIEEEQLKEYFTL